MPMQDEKPLDYETCEVFAKMNTKNVDGWKDFITEFVKARWSDNIPMHIDSQLFFKKFEEAQTIEKEQLIEFLKKKEIIVNKALFDIENYPEENKKSPKSILDFEFHMRKMLLLRITTLLVLEAMDFEDMKKEDRKVLEEVKVQVCELDLKIRRSLHDEVDKHAITALFHKIQRERPIHEIVWVKDWVMREVLVRLRQRFFNETNWIGEFISKPGDDAPSAKRAKHGN